MPGHTQLSCSRTAFHVSLPATEGWQHTLWKGWEQEARGSDLTGCVLGPPPDPLGRRKYCVIGNSTDYSYTSETWSRVGRFSWYVFIELGEGNSDGLQASFIHSFTHLRCQVYVVRMRLTFNAAFDQATSLIVSIGCAFNTYPIPVPRVIEPKSISAH